MLILFCPIDSNLSFSHFGDSFTTTFLIILHAYLGHASLSIISIFIFLSTAGDDSVKFLLGIVIFLFSSIAISLATPKWLKQSPLFGVKSISMTLSLSESR